MTGQSSILLQKYDGASSRKKAFSHMKEEARLHSIVSKAVFLKL